MTLTLPFISRKKRNKPAIVAQDRPDEDPVEARYRPIDGKLVLRLFKCLAPFKWYYATGIALGLVMVLAEMQGPRYIQMIINTVLGFHNGAPGAATSAGSAVLRVMGTVGLWAATLGVAILLQRWIILTMTNVGEKVQFGIRRTVFAHLQKLSMSFYDKTKLGRIISRCTSDINSMREVNIWGIYHFFIYGVQMVFAATMMFLTTDWRLFVAVAWLGPVLYMCNVIYRRKAGRMWQVVREGFTRVSTNLAENITGVRVVTAFNRQVPNLGTFNNLQFVNTVNNVHAARVNGIYQPLLQLIGVLGKVIILTYGGYLLVSGRIGVDKGVGAVVAAFLYWDWFMAPIVAFGNLYNQLMMAMASAERVFNLLDTQPEVQDVPNAVELPRIKGHVKFEHVTFGYDPNRPVLHDICFEAHPGQMIALVGHTGCGKSSIISLIARFYQPQQGRILVDGYDIRYVIGDSLHKQMGLVLQTNYLFSGSVYDNIRYVKPSATEQEVIAAAKAIGSYDAIMSLKDGLHTEVGERGASMSLGQRQLICFTRAFLADPRIFMLDEATSAVDTATEMQVQRSLERLLEGRTTFIVAHRLSTILRADCILVLDHGRIIERGTHHELLSLGGRYAHLYQQFIMQSE